MNTFKYGKLSILFIVTIVLQGVIADGTYAQSFPHLKILVFKFGGIKDVDRQDKFDEFIDAIRRAIDEIKLDYPDKNPPYAYLSDMKYKDFTKIEAPSTDKTRKVFYENERALEMHTGFVGFEKDIVYVRNYIFLNNTLANSLNRITLTHNVSAEEYSSLKNIQQAIMCYALAMDAKRINKDTSITSGFLAKAFNLVSNIDSGKILFAQLLKGSIEKELNVLKTSKFSGGIN